MKGLNDTEKKELIPNDLIFLGYRGSIAHGMYVPNTDPNSIDDKDVMGVFIAPSSHYIGTKKVKDTREKWYKEWDCVHYELLKLAGLLEKGNPNVLSLLWLNDRYVIHRSPEWDFLVSNRDAFSSKAVYHSFVGYAHGQLHISIYDGEGYAIKLSNDPVAVINAMHLTDADRVDIITQSNKYIGYIILVYDNDSYDVIHDYSESLTDFMLPIETFAESLIPQ